MKKLPMLLSRDAQILIHPLCTPTSKARLDWMTQRRKKTEDLTRGLYRRVDEAEFELHSLRFARSGELECKVSAALICQRMKMSEDAESFETNQTSSMMLKRRTRTPTPQEKSGSGVNSSNTRAPEVQIERITLVSGGPMANELIDDTVEPISTMARSIPL